MFTKDDLKNGDYVVTRDGDVGVVIVDFKDYGIIIQESGDRYCLDKVDYYLKNKFDTKYDIIKVYRPSNNFQCGFKLYSNGKLVYDETEYVEEMTLAEVCKALGKNIKIIKE